MELYEEFELKKNNQFLNKRLNEISVREKADSFNAQAAIEKKIKFNNSIRKINNSKIQLENNQMKKRISSQSSFFNSKQNDLKFNEFHKKVKLKMSNITPLKSMMMKKLKFMKLPNISNNKDNEKGNNNHHHKDYYNLNSDNNTSNNNHLKTVSEDYNNDCYSRFQKFNNLISSKGFNTTKFTYINTNTNPNFNKSKTKNKSIYSFKINNTNNTNDNSGLNTNRNLTSNN